MDILLTDQIFTIILRLVASVLFGGIIGLERDIHGRAAGLRTNILVCLGSALFMIISQQVAIDNQIEGETVLRIDPSRIAAQIVSGIGFLGAGAIIKEGFSIKGLTTAATLWLIAGIGMASGSGYIALAGVATFIGLICLVFLSIIEKKYRKHSYSSVEVQFTFQNSFDIKPILDVVNRKNFKVINTKTFINYEEKKVSLVLFIRSFQKGLFDPSSNDIINSLHETKYSITSIKWA